MDPEFHVVVWNGEYEGETVDAYHLQAPHTQIATDTMSVEKLQQSIRAYSKRPHCSISVSPDYVKDQLDKNSILLGLIQKVPSRSSTRSVTQRFHEEMVGFILANPTEDGGIYLDVICSKPRTGTPFLHFFLYYCELLEASYVELSALINVLAYYPTFGFEHRKDCSKPAEVAMPVYLQEKLKKGMRDGIYKNASNYIKDAQLFEYVMHLHRMGYTTRKEDCTSLNLKNDDFKKHECDQDGFKMRKCIAPIKPLASTGIPGATTANIQALVARHTGVPATAVRPTRQRPTRTSTMRVRNTTYATRQARTRATATRKNNKPTTIASRTRASIRRTTTRST